ncbi:MAG: hypothetical protein K1X75_01575 [Leptospirales bacterium]|nr:hypothetical protein [Leptospirales bacterium]
MNREIRKLFAEMVGVSMNSDQVNELAQKVSRGFDIRHATGFGSVIAIPRHAAAEALIHELRSEERVVEFFELMLENDGKFVFDSTLKIVYREDFIKLLENCKWIYDADTRRFLRDPFHQEQVNFLNSIKMIDLRHTSPGRDLGTQLKSEAERLQVHDLSWQVTVRTYRLGADTSALIRDLLEMLLRKQELGALAGEIFTALNELMINASKATYKSVFQKERDAQIGSSGQPESKEFAAAFREELELHGDERLAELARAADSFFDVHFKSMPEHVVCWAVNYTTISGLEKLRLLNRLHFPLSEEALRQVESDAYREGAGLGINLVLSILGRLSPDRRPLKPVFYPDRTKIGFVLRRRDLQSAQRS